jgi:hypothetical protein
VVRWPQAARWVECTYKTSTSSQVDRRQVHPSHIFRQILITSQVYDYLNTPTSNKNIDLVRDEYFEHWSQKIWLRSPLILEEEMKRISWN